MSQRITIRELKKYLSIHDDDSELIFGTGDLTFYRVKSRGNNLVQIEFNEIYELHPSEYNSESI